MQFNKERKQMQYPNLMRRKVGTLPFWRMVSKTADAVRVQLEAAREVFRRQAAADVTAVDLPTDERWAEAQAHRVDREVVRLSQLIAPTEAERAQLVRLTEQSQGRQMLRAIASLRRGDHA